MTAIALRPATPADSEFCFQLHKSAMGDYTIAIWGWDEQVQRDFHARAFNPGSWQIITAGGADIGMLNVEYRPAEIYLALRRGRTARTSSLTCSPSTTAPRPSTSDSA